MLTCCITRSNMAAVSLIVRGGIAQVGGGSGRTVGTISAVEAGTCMIGNGVYDGGWRYMSLFGHARAFVNGMLNGCSRWCGCSVLDWRELVGGFCGCIRRRR